MVIRFSLILHQLSYIFDDWQVFDPIALGNTNVKTLNKVYIKYDDSGLIFIHLDILKEDIKSNIDCKNIWIKMFEKYNINHQFDDKIQQIYTYSYGLIMNTDLTTNRGN